MFITKHNKGHFKLLLLKILPDWRAFSLKGSWKSVICVHVWLDFLVWSEIKDNEARDTWGPLIMYEHSSMYTHAHTSSLSIYNICYICICYAYIYNILYIISILWSIQLFNLGWWLVRSRDGKIWLLFDSPLDFSEGEWGRARKMPKCILALPFLLSPTLSHLPVVLY